MMIYVSEKLDCGIDLAPILDGVCCKLHASPRRRYDET